MTIKRITITILSLCIAWAASAQNDNDLPVPGSELAEEDTLQESVKSARLHRDGTVAQPAKGNIFKGPFHIPRMLVKTWELTKDM